MKIFSKENVGVGMLVAIALLMASGVGYRLLAEHLARPNESIPLAPGTLARLPLELAGWSGSDMSLDASLIRATDSDDHLARVYQRRGSRRVTVFVAYGIRARDLMPHRPEVCYPAAGWTLRNSKPVELSLGNGSKLPSQIYRFDRGAFGQETMTVLNYYILDGQYSPDVSLLRTRAWRGSSAVRYLVQVQISCHVASGDLPLSLDFADRSVQDFATVSALELRSLLPSIVKPDSVRRPETIRE